MQSIHEYAQYLTQKYKPFTTKPPEKEKSDPETTHPKNKLK
jgi:hypothetical protein